MIPGVAVMFHVWVLNYLILLYFYYKYENNIPVYVAVKDRMNDRTDRSELTSMLICCG